MSHPLFDAFDVARKALHDHVGYVEDWRVLPEDDATQYFWQLDGEDDGSYVRFALTEEELSDDSENYYSNEIYTQRHLPKWVYRGAELTMIVVDTHTDGNQFLQFFSNDKEVK